MFRPFLCSDREFVEAQSFSFSKKCALCQTSTHKKRLTSEGASDNEKKDDAAYTFAKFVHLF